MSTLTKPLTLGARIELQHRFLDHNDIFDLTLDEIGKLLLKDLLGAEWSGNDEETRFAYSKLTGDDEILSDQARFYSQVACTLLEIDRHPKDELFRLYRKATKDLKSIDSQIEVIDGKTRTLGESKNLDTSQRYYRNQLLYFREKNVRAKDEILDFLKGGIECYALDSCRSSRISHGILGGRSLFRVPYRYASALNHPLGGSYDPESLTDLSNKFLELRIGTHKKMEQLYRSDRARFYEVADQYVGGDIEHFGNAIGRIREFVKKSYILQRREDVIEHLLERYAAGDFLTFANIAPLQIEGIFNDICLAIGITQSELGIASVNHKLDRINPLMDDFHFYEYYSFKFPIVRNLVAHGELIADDLKHTALMLLLDLLPVCKLTTSKNIPVNNAYSLLCIAAESRKVKDILAWQLVSTIALPESLNGGPLIDLVHSAIGEETFWKALEEEFLSAEDEGKQIGKMVGEMKAQGLATAQAKEFLKLTVPQLKFEKARRAERSKELLRKIQLLLKKEGDSE